MPPAWARRRRSDPARGDAIARSDLAISGTDLQALGVRGPRIGEIAGCLAGPGAGRARAQYPRCAPRPCPEDAVNPLGFAVAAALGNVAGALAVVRHLRRGLRFIDACLAFGAGFMLAVTVLGVLPEVLHGSPGAALYVLLGYFAVHLAQHVFTPHFHFGEETHRRQRRGREPAPCWA